MERDSETKVSALAQDLERTRRELDQTRDAHDKLRRDNEARTEEFSRALDAARRETEQAREAMARVTREAPSRSRPWVAGIVFLLVGGSMVVGAERTGVAPWLASVLEEAIIQEKQRTDGERQRADKAEQDYRTALETAKTHAADVARERERVSATQLEITRISEALKRAADENAALSARAVEAERRANGAEETKAQAVEDARKQASSAAEKEWLERVRAATRKAAQAEAQRKATDEALTVAEKKASESEEQRKEAETARKEADKQKTREKDRADAAEKALADFKRNALRGRTAEFTIYRNFDLEKGDRPPKIEDVDWSACQLECVKNSDWCEALSYDRFRRVCYLKEEIKSLRMEPNSDSAVLRGKPTPAKFNTRPVTQRFTDMRFTGNSYSKDVLSTWDQCKAKCEAQESRCRAFTFYENTRECVLFERPENWIADKSAISGIRRQLPLD